MGYTGDLQNNGGGSWTKYRDITVTAPAQSLANGYSVKFVAIGADAAAIFAASQADRDDVRLEHNITSPAATTLNGAITAIQTTITLTSVAGYPLTGMIIVDSERIAYSGITGNVLQNCVRGASGSTAAAHNSGATVTYVKEMERHVETFTSSNVTIWFKLRADIAETTADANYRLYYGNSLAGAAPATIDSVFTKDYGETGLVGLWHMDEGEGLPQDSSGAGHHVTSNTAVWQTGDGGQWDGQAGTGFIKGNRLFYNGTTVPKTNLGDVTDYESVTDITIMAHIRLSGLNKWQGFFTKESCYLLDVSDTNKLAMIRGSGSSWTDGWYYGTTILTTSVNYFVVWQITGTTWRLYLNGVLDGSGTMANTGVGGNTQSTVIGYATSGDSHHVEGDIDEMRVITGRTVTADEINAHYKRRMWVAGDTVAIDGNFAVAGDEQSLVPPERTISVKFIAS